MQKFFLKLLFLSGIFFSCSSEEEILDTSKTEDLITENVKRIPIVLTNEETAINEQIHNFSFHFINEYAKLNKKENYCVSPLSTSFLMGLLLNGAENSTYSQIQKTLGGENIEATSINAYFKKLREGLKETDKNSLFTEANSLWVKRGVSLLTDYVKTSENYYGASLKENQLFNTETVDAINNWGKEQTNGKITKFIDNTSEIANLNALFLNTIYFKGGWISSFLKESTQNKAFILGNGQSIQVPTMYQEMPALGGENEEITIVPLGLGNGSFYIYFFLPTNSQIKVDDLLSSLTKEKWTQWKKTIQICKLQISLPRFDVENESSLKNILETMGIVDAFTSAACFTKISNQPFSLGLIKQKTNFTINEEGVEGASITGTGLLTDGSAKLPTLQVDFNRPFGFILSEVSTGTILFAGKIGNPNVN